MIIDRAQIKQVFAAYVSNFDPDDPKMILRDADKLDIFRVNLETPLEQIYNVTSEELYHCSVSPAVMQAFDEHHAVLRELKSTPIDYVVGHICMAFELIYPESRRLAIEQGYLQKLMEFQSNDLLAKQQMSYIRGEMILL